MKVAKKLPASKFTTTWLEGELVKSRWKATYEQPDGLYLVTTVSEFYTYCAQFRRGETPDDVLREMVDTGALADAPLGLLRELEGLGVIKLVGPQFIVTS